MVDRSVTADDFSLLSVIGKGSYGKVLLVRKNDTGELFAMKILKKDYIAQRKQIDHTKTERSVLERVNHPFIVKLRYAYQTSKKLFFVLDYCKGGELFFHLSRERRFSEEKTAFYAACIVLAIEELHNRNIIYRDLKPENILVDEQGYIKITDFGLSKENIEGHSEALSFCGTPEYLAPEILLKKGHGKAVDWWSLASLIYEMLTGLPPFYTRDRERLFNSILNGEVNYPPTMSENVKSLLSQLFVKDPLNRLGSGPGDSEEIKSHPWFAGFDWNALLRKEVPPPFVPVVGEDMGVSNFESEFTRAPVESGPRDNTLNAASPTYQGFSYNDDRLNMDIDG